MFYSPISMYFERLGKWLKEPTTVTRFALYSFPYFLVFIVIGFFLLIGFFNRRGFSRTDDIIYGLALFAIGTGIAIVAVKFKDRK